MSSVVLSDWKKKENKMKSLLQLTMNNAQLIIVMVYLELTNKQYYLQKIHYYD